MKTIPDSHVGILHLILTGMFHEMRVTTPS